MRDRESPARVHGLARWLVARYGRQAAAIAATLVDNGQIDYAQMWQQVARLASTLLGSGDV